MTLDEYMRNRYVYYGKLKRWLTEHELTERLLENISRLVSGAWREE